MCIPEHYNQDEDTSQNDITNIAPYIVEGRKRSNRMGTFEIIVASILVTNTPFWILWIIPHSLNIFTVLPNSALKLTFMDKIFVVKLQARPLPSWRWSFVEEDFAVVLWPTKSTKIFNCYMVYIHIIIKWSLASWRSSSCISPEKEKGNF